MFLLRVVVLLVIASILSAQRGLFPIGPWPGQAPLTGRRMALILGNTNYVKAPPLKNPVNDANDVHALLTKELGFQAKLVLDAKTSEAIRQAVLAFHDSLQEGDVAVLYYSGHGLQIAGENYALPTEFEAASEAEAAERAYPIRNFANLAKAKKARLTILILDACRDNPFRKWDRTNQREKGLNSMGGGDGLFVALAAEKGKIASDNTAERNGLYTKHLLLQLRKEGLGLSKLFDAVRDGVATASARGQVPFHESGVVGEFTFRPDQRSTEARSEWAQIKDYQNRAAFVDFIAKYAGTIEAELAKERVKGMAAAPRANPSLAPAEKAWREGRVQEALKLYREAALNGSSKAMVELSYIYLNADAWPGHRQEAIAWAKRAEEAGEADGLTLQAFAKFPRETSKLSETRQQELLSEIGPLLKQARSAGSLLAKAFPLDVENESDWKRLRSEVIQSGNTHAMFMVFVVEQVLDEGKSLAEDKYDRQLFAKLLVAGEPGAYGIYGLLLSEKKKYAEARKYLRKAADAGLLKPAKDLAKLLGEGEGGPVDAPESLRFRRLVALSDYATIETWNDLGDDLEDGDGGLKEDPREALTWFRKGAEKGDSQAIDRMISAYCREGPVWNPKEAAVWGEKLVQQEPTFYQTYHAKRLVEGKCLPRDVPAAERIYRKAGAKHADALWELGELYATGNGVKKDPAMAAGLYQQAASEHSTNGMLAWARALREGFGVPRDPKAAVLALYEARRWLVRMEGVYRFGGSDYVDPIRNELDTMLAEMLVKGEGKTDVLEGVRFYQEAAARGYEPARKALDELKIKY